MIKFNIRIFFYIAVVLYPAMYLSLKILCHNKIMLGAKFSAIIFVIAVLLCAAEDFISKTIPDFFNAMIFISGSSFSLSTGGWKNMLIAIIESSILLFFLIVVFHFAKGGFGGGDIKMAAAVSALIGPMSAVMNICYAAMLASPLCLAAVIFTLTTRSNRGKADKKARRQLTLPFGPFYAFCVLIELNQLFQIN